MKKKHKKNEQDSFVNPVQTYIILLYNDNNNNNNNMRVRRLARGAPP